MGRELGRISGPLLAENLLRNGNNLAFDSKLIYLDVVNGYIGINTDTPTRNLLVDGTLDTTNLIVDTSATIADLEFTTNQIQNVTGGITFTPFQSVDPTVTVPKFKVSNLEFTNNSISNLTNGANIVLDTNGSGTVIFNTNKVDITGSLHATGDITWDGTITLGNNDLDNVTFNADVNSKIVPDADNTYDIGASGKEWRNLYAHDLKFTALTSSALTVNNINLLLTQGNTIYVSVNGSDSKTGTHLHDPYLTIKKALSVAVAGDEIVIFPGTYTEIFPLTVPQGVSVRGMDIRNVIVKPTVGTNTNNAFLMNGETTVSFLTVKDFYAPGDAFSFASNFTVTTRSPYVQNVTVITASTTLPSTSVGSALFTSTPSQYLSIPNNAAFTQNQPFTIETWFYPTTLNGGYVWAMLQPNFLTVAYRASGKFQIDMSYVGNPPGYSPSNRTYPINNWYHIALTWNGTAGKLFINGVIEATFTGAGATVSAGNPFLIGQYQGQGQRTPLGNITNFRVVKGLAVYTGTFTPPTAPLTVTQSAGTNISAITAGQTQLLLLEDTSANLLKDSSTNNFTVTNNGTVTWSALSPVTGGPGGTIPAGNGALVDGSLANGASKEAAMLFYAVTMIVPDAIGIQATNGARVEWLNGFTYFANKGIYLTEGTLGFASLGVKYGAEMRSIGSSNIYGTYGAYADGLHTLGYLIGHNFGYIGSGLDSQNDYGLVEQSNEVVAINGAQLYYDSTDQKGDYRIGDIFLVEQSTGKVSFNAQAINYTANGTITLEGLGGRTFIHAPAIEVGNIRIHDNNIDSMSGPVNFLAFSGSTYLNTNVTVTGNTDITGDTNIKGTLTTFGNEATDTVTVLDYLTQTIKPDLNNTYTLGKIAGTEKRWNTLFATLLDVDGVTQLTNNTITTLTADTDLRLIAAGSGIVQVTTTDVNITNNLTVVGSSDLQDVTILGTLNLPGIHTYSQTGNTSRTGNTNITGHINVYGIHVVQFEDIKFDSNKITTTFGDNDLIFTANGAGIVKIINSDVKIDNDLTVNLTGYFNSITATNVGADAYDIDSVYITGNTITTNVTDTDLVLSADGTGKIKVTTTDVVVTNDLEVNQLTTLTNVGITGLLDLTGDYTWTHTGASDRTGNTDITGSLTVNGANTVQFDDIQFVGNVVRTTLGTDLELSADGTGIVKTMTSNVEITNNLNVLDTGYLKEVIVTTGVSPSDLDLDFVVGNISISGNTINVTTSNLILSADNAGEIHVTTTDVVITNNLAVNQLTTLTNVNIGTSLSPKTLAHTGAYTWTHTGASDRTGNTDITGSLTVNGAHTVQFDDISILNNVVTTNITNNDLILGAITPANIVNVISTDVKIDQDLTVDLAIDANSVQITHGVTADDFYIGDFYIKNNISIVPNNTDLILGATGVVKFKDSDVNIANDLTVINDVSVAGTTSLKNTVIRSETLTPTVTQVSQNLSGTTDPTGFFFYGWQILHPGQTEPTFSVIQPGWTVVGQPTWVVTVVGDGITNYGITITGGSFATGGTYSFTGDVLSYGPATLTQNGNINQTGSTYVTGNFQADGDISVTGPSRFISVHNVKIDANVISATVTDDDLELSANGTGGVRLERYIKITDNDISNIFDSNNAELGFNNLLLAEDGQQLILEAGDFYLADTLLDGDLSIKFVPNGTGNLVINSNTAFAIAYGNNTNRVLKDVGEIRQNSTTQVYEGKLNTGFAKFNNVYDSDGNTYITPEATPGANDNTLRFGINGVTKAYIDSTKLFSNILESDNVRFSGTTITNKISANNLELLTTGSGVVNVNNISLAVNEITNNEDSALVFANSGTGYVKFTGTSGIVFPRGPSLSPTIIPERGETRYNTDYDYLEVFDGTNWIAASGSSNFATEEEILLELNIWSLVLG